MTRQWLFALSIAVLAGAWLGPLPVLARQSFTAHMVLHVAVIAVAAPLLAFGMAGARFDPVRRMPAIFSPIPASIVEFIVVWAWHAPALHHAARQSLVTLFLEQCSFLVVGWLVWMSAFGGSGLQRRQRAIASVSGLLLTSMHMTLLGVLLALSGRALYAHHAVRLFELTPLQDQHLGGLIMLFVGGSAYLAGALYLVAALLKGKQDAISPN